MAASCFKVESGIQLLARLSKKTNVENFYPMLFESGPKQSEVIELFSNVKLSCLLVDITYAALLPGCMGGVEAGVLIFNCDGHLNYNILLTSFQNKIKAHLGTHKSTSASSNNIFVQDNDKSILEKMLNNLYIVDIYDSNQFYTTIYNLESILMENSNISMVIFDSLTAFYWSEQSFKIIKMDTYLRKNISKIQKVTREHKVIIIYTRPEHFSSSKDLENLEVCSEFPTMERINYRIHIVYMNDGMYKVNITTFNKQIIKHFYILDDEVIWK